MLLSLQLALSVERLYQLALRLHRLVLLSLRLFERLLRGLQLDALEAANGRLFLSRRGRGERPRLRSLCHAAQLMLTGGLAGAVSLAEAEHIVLNGRKLPLKGLDSAVQHDVLGFKRLHLRRGQRESICRRAPLAAHRAHRLVHIGLKAVDRRPIRTADPTRSQLGHLSA